MNILVADDTHLMRSMLGQWLASFGHEITLASDGAEALILARSRNFDMIIADWEMPRLDGMELCWTLRAGKCQPYTYILPGQSGERGG